MIWWPTAIWVVCFVRCLLAEKTFDEDRDLLMKHLLKDYHPSSKAGRSNETLMVFVNIELQHFDFRERDGSFHLVGLLHVWRDPRLVWHPQNFGNVSHIMVSQRNLWIPDLEFYNNAPDKFVRMHRNGFVTVKNDGVVFWSDTIDVHMFCTKYMKNWPHDKHECLLHLGSWTFDGFELDIMHVNPNASMSFEATNNQNMQYKVTQFNGSHVSKYYSCCLQPYITMDYNITFERESAYVVIFRIPAIAVMVITLLALTMGSARTHKFWLNALSLWLICGNLIYFALNSRNFSTDTPNIVVFYSTSFVLVTLSQLIAVFSAVVTHSTFNTDVPHLLQRLLKSPLALKIVSYDPNSESQRHSVGEFDDVKLDDISGLLTQHTPQIDWLQLVELLRRVALLCFAGIFLTLSTICFV